MTRARFLKELRARELAVEPPEPRRITAADLALLPEPVQRYLDFMRVGGNLRDWSFRAGFTGRFRLAPDQAFMPCEAWQYDSSSAGITRIFETRMRFWGLVPVVARDTYLEGRGRMRAKLLDLFSVEDASGAELDIGELVTYLNDAILFAPSLLFALETSWKAVEDRVFEVALTDQGRTVRAQVTIDGHGRPLDFSTTDRFVRDPYDPKHPLIRARWTTPVRGWKLAGDRPIFTRGQAIWHLAQGPFAYAEMSVVPGSVAFNVRPGE